MSQKNHRRRPFESRPRFPTVVLALALLAALAGVSQTSALDDGKEKADKEREGRDEDRLGLGNGNNKFYAFSLGGE